MHTIINILSYKRKKKRQINITTIKINTAESNQRFEQTNAVHKITNDNQFGLRFCVCFCLSDVIFTSESDGHNNNGQSHGTSLQYTHTHQQPSLLYSRMQHILVNIIIMSVCCSIYINEHFVCLAASVCVFTRFFYCTNIFCHFYNQMILLKLTLVVFCLYDADRIRRRFVMVMAFIF